MESRKIIYGFFYFLIAAAVLWGSYKIFFSSAPSCSDGILNQGEENIDCGGPCVPCDSFGFTPLKIEPPQIMSVDGEGASVLVRVLNDNKDYDADFSYKITFYNKKGEIMDELIRRDFVASLDSTLLVATGFRRPVDIKNVDVEIFEVEWSKSIKSLKPKVDLVFASTTIDEKNIVISGLVKNNSLVSGFDLKITAVLMDQFGFSIFASQTFIDNFDSFAEEKFVIKVPAYSFLLKRIDSARTKIYLNSR